MYLFLLLEPFILHLAALHLTSDSQSVALQAHWTHCSGSGLECVSIGGGEKAAEFTSSLFSSSALHFFHPVELRFCFLFFSFLWTSASSICVCVCFFTEPNGLNLRMHLPTGEGRPSPVCPPAFISQTGCPCVVTPLPAAAIICSLWSASAPAQPDSRLHQACSQT